MDSQTRYIPTCAECGEEIDYYCEDIAKNICQNCCSPHDYEYDRNRRGHFCLHCDKERPIDYYRD